MLSIDWQSFLLGAGTVLIGSTLVALLAAWATAAVERRYRAAADGELVTGWRRQPGTGRGTSRSDGVQRPMDSADLELAAIDPRLN